MVCALRRATGLASAAAVLVIGTGTSPVGAQSADAPPAPAPVAAPAAAPQEQAPATGVVQPADPKWKVTLTGTLRTLFIVSDPRPFPVGAVFFLLPNTDTVNVNINARSSSMGAIVTGPKLGSFRVGGAAMAVFLSQSLVSDDYGVLPVRLYGDLTNERWRIAAGLMDEVFSPRGPTVVDAIGQLSASGNVGNASRAMFRLERYVALGDTGKLTIVGDAAETKSTAAFPELKKFVLAGRYPNFEGSLRFELGRRDPDALARVSPVEVGVSGFVGQNLTVFTDVLNPIRNDIHGVAIDGSVRLGSRVVVQGEFATGHGLGNYSGAIAQTVDPRTDLALDSSNGWAQLTIYWSRVLQTNAGYGLDVPELSQLTPGSFSRNEAAYANVIWDISRNVQVSFEPSWRRTEYVGLSANDGPFFMSAFQVRF